MSATKRIETLDEGGIFARIDKHVLPDLDDVLLEMIEHRRYQDGWDDWDDEDQPTMISRTAEATVKHKRISPCFCGDHGWHLDWVHEDEEGMPDRSDGRGAFLAVTFDD
jgi:hypothetical protein